MPIYQPAWASDNCLFISETLFLNKYSLITSFCWNMSEFKKTTRNTVLRQAARGHYDQKTVYSILDEGYLCHAGFSVGGRPFVIPTLYARSGDSVFIHGSAVSRMLKEFEKGIDVCITVTLVDGIVLARSAFHHSMNYRSVLVFGKGRLVKETEEKLRVLEKISENLLPGRWKDSRKPTRKELDVTSVIKIPISEASAKIRKGDPSDDQRDYELPIWAGVLPIETGFGTPLPDTRLADGIDLPDYLETL